jgi:ABC-type dipeptide/oligopeptide/nickel transport system permease subunit
VTRAGVMRRLRSSRLAAVGLVGSGLLVVAALLGPWLLPHPIDPQQIIKGPPQALLLGPSSAHPFGTDWYGLDVFSRVLAGARPTVAIGLASSAATVLIGLFVGLTCGYAGGLTDALGMRLVDVVMAFPSLLLAILIAATMEPGFTSIFLALVLVGWAGTARLVRSIVLSMRRQEMVLAAITLGASPARVVLRHILPNIVSTVLVIFTSRIGVMVLSEASLNFLGLGAPSVAASWGVMVYYGIDHISDGPWCAVFPASAIAFTVLVFNFLGDGLRDALDPRLRMEGS